jgi:hypothetical protein
MISASKDGFQTKAWGPPAWFFLHIITLNYSIERKEETKKFFNSLGGVLPCGACRTNFKTILKDHYPLTDLVLSSRRNLALWLFNVHNKVQSDIHINSKNTDDKVQYKVKHFGFVMRKYETLRAKCARDQHGCLKPKHGKKRYARILIRTTRTKPSIVFK